MPSLRQLSEQRRASSSNQIQRRPAAHQLLSYPIGGIRGIILPSILQAAAAAENDHQGPSIDSGSSTINELTEGQRRGYSRIVDTLTDYITENRIGPQPANFTEIFSSNMPNENIQNAIRYIRQHQQAAQTQQEPPVESNGEGGPSIRLVNPFGGSGGVLFGPSASTSTGGGGGTPTGSFSITITTRDGSPPQNNGTSEARTSFPEYTGVHFVPMDQGVGNSQQQQIPTASSTSTSTNGGAETSSHSTQTPSSSPSPAQPQNPLHAFIGSLMQCIFYFIAICYIFTGDKTQSLAAFSSFLGTGGPQTPPATFTTPPRTSSNSNSTGGQTPGNNTAARQQSQIHHAASFTTNTGILGFPGIGNNNTGRSEGGVSAAANGFAFLHPNRPILRPLRQNGGNGNNGGSGNPGGDGRTPPRTSEIGRISLSRGGDPSSRQQSQTTPLQVGVRRTYDQRPRSTSPRVAVFSGGGANNAEGPIRRMRRLTPELHQQMFGEAPIHWNQASAHVGIKKTFYYTYGFITFFSPKM